jgi:hypothetical protein
MEDPPPTPPSGSIFNNAKWLFYKNKKLLLQHLLMMAMVSRKGFQSQ